MLVVNGFVTTPRMLMFVAVATLELTILSSSLWLALAQADRVIHPVRWYKYPVVDSRKRSTMTVNL